MYISKKELMKLNRFFFILSTLSFASISGMEKPSQEPKQRATSIPSAIPNLDIRLEIEPNSIQKTVLDLGMDRKYTDIDTIIQNTSDFENLKKILLLQLNLAIFIVKRISYSLAIEDSNAFKYHEQQPLITEEFDDWQTQWLHLLFTSKEKLKETNSLMLLEQALILVHKFLEDIGYVYHDYPIESFNESNLLKWMKNYKTELGQNFKLLFEHLFVVMPLKPNQLPAMSNFINAINDNDAAKVKRLISFGIPIEDPKDTVNNQPLTLALTKGNEKIIELLVKAGASITKKFANPAQVTKNYRMAGLNNISIADYQRNLMLACIIDLAKRQVTSQEEELHKAGCKKTVELINKYEKLERENK